MRRSAHFILFAAILAAAVHTILNGSAVGLATAPGTGGAGVAEQDHPSVTLRLLTYNIKHGLGNDGVIDLERAAAVIESLEPDLVALQEIDRGVERTEGVDQAERLGELTGMYSAFGDFMDYQGGQYGMAILSRFPIVERENHRLPPGAEPRSALAVRVRLGDTGKEVVFVGVHLYRTLAERLCQAAKVFDAVATETVPVIVAGDFNSTPDSEVMSLVRKSWTLPDKGDDRLTFSADDPRREIDFIAYRPEEAFEVIESRVIDEPLVSDHRPVLLVLRMR